MMHYIQWALANYQDVLMKVGAVIAAASATILALKQVGVALGALVDKLAEIFPALKKADGGLHWFLAGLDWLSDKLQGWAKWGPLNAVAMNTQHVARVALLFLALATLTPMEARAQDGGSPGPDWSSGPTLPLLQVRLAPEAGAPPVTQLAAGAGYGVSAGFLPKVIAGKQMDLISVELAAFAGLSDKGGALSLALMGCLFGDLVCLGVGSDLLAVGPSGTSGLLTGHETKSNLMTLLALGVPFDLAPHAAAQTPSNGN